MLGVFRKYQKYIYFVVTVVIIISFSFFGTYSTMMDQSTSEPIIFHAVDGSKVSRSELGRMILFLQSDERDKLLSGGAWGPNFFNDGVITKDFLETGLAEILVAQYPEEQKEELQKRLQKEKRYTPYVHPTASFISAQGVWERLVPSIKTNLDALLREQDAISPEAFAMRVRLFLAEQELPAPLLRQVLQYQQTQHQGVTQDPNLNRIDLALFEYHSLEDWFGPQFVPLVAQFVINAAKIAEQKGYYVSREEALAELIYNADASFEQHKKGLRVDVRTAGTYFNEQLRRMSMDQNQAIKVWRQVMLFRRLFHDFGGSVFIDPMTYENINAYAKGSIEGNFYQLPKELRFQNYRALQKFETYLSAVAPHANSGIGLPETFFDTETVAKKTPEFVQKRYFLEVSEANKKRLQGKVSMREMWDWEAKDQNWEQLKKNFPDLGMKKGETREERFAALESLDKITRSRVDAFARAAVVDEHPDWLKEALEEADQERKIVALTKLGGKSPFVGLKERAQLMDLLDAAPLGEQSAELEAFTADHNQYYRIVVLERSPKEEVLTFAEADKAGILDEKLDRQLEAFYVKERGKYSQEFQLKDGTWKPFANVKDQVADHYFESTLAAIRASTPKQAATSDAAAFLRFYSYVNTVKEQIESNPGAIEKLSYDGDVRDIELGILERKPLADQWKLEKKKFRMLRNNENKRFDIDALFALKEGEWSEIQIPSNGEIGFLHIKEHGVHIEKEDLSKQINDARALLSSEAQQQLMHRLLDGIKDKDAIALETRERDSNVE